MKKAVTLALLLLFTFACSFSTSQPAPPVDTPTAGIDEGAAPTTSVPTDTATPIPPTATVSPTATPSASETLLGVWQVEGAWDAVKGREDSRFRGTFTFSETTLVFCVNWVVDPMAQDDCRETAWTLSGNEIGFQFSSSGGVTIWKGTLDANGISGTMQTGKQQVLGWWKATK